MGWVQLFVNSVSFRCIQILYLCVSFHFSSKQLMTVCTCQGIRNTPSTQAWRSEDSGNVNQDDSKPPRASAGLWLVCSHAAEVWAMNREMIRQGKRGWLSTGVIRGPVSHHGRTSGFCYCKPLIFTLDESATDWSFFLQGLRDRNKGSAPCITETKFK